jgi:hypothetical protein
VIIRAAMPPDIEALVALCAAHATYEQVTVPANGQSTRLAGALFGASPRPGATSVVKHRFACIRDDSPQLAGRAA